MKILVAHNSYLNAGGEDAVARQEAQLLRDHGHTVIEYRRSNEEIESTSIGRLSLLARAVWARDSHRDFLALIGRERPDLAHFHNTFPLISPSVYYACRKLGVPVVQTLHNYRLVCPSGNLFRDQQACSDCLSRRLPTPALLHRCYRGSLIQSGAVVTMLLTHRALRTWEKAVDLFIAPSSYVAAQVIRGGIPPPKLLVKPNFTAPPPPAPAHNTRRHALFVGRLTAEKGVLTLIDAWRGVSDLPLLIVGDGPEKDRLAKRISQGTLRNIELVGEQPRSIVQGLLQSAAFLVMPSEWPEPFGLVAAEAFSCGVPVIGARSGAIPEIVEDPCAELLFNPGDPHQLSGRVRWAIAHPDELRKMGQRARQAYAQKYSPHSNYPLLIDAYKKAIAHFETVDRAWALRRPTAATAAPSRSP